MTHGHNQRIVRALEMALQNAVSQLLWRIAASQFLGESGADAVGIMQVHLPTWGHRADKEGINLFKIEDNVEFGVRILKDYVHRFGLWEGVKRYNGFLPENPASGQSATEYVGKVQRVYDHKSDTEQALE